MQMDPNFRVLPGRRFLQKKKKIKRLTYHEHFRRFQNETFVGSSNADAAALAETVNKDKNNNQFPFSFIRLSTVDIPPDSPADESNSNQNPQRRDLAHDCASSGNSPDIPLTNELTFIQSSRM